MRIAVFTTTRAEFGILSSFLKAVENDPESELLLFVGGTHLKEKFGYTIDEIHSLGFEVTDTFDYLEEGSSSRTLVNSVSNCVKLIGDLFEKNEFDFTCVLGDRYELIPIVIASMLYQRPIVHWGGGDVTLGVIDEQVRHMITKAAHIHFPSCDMYASNIKQMGEEPWRVYNVGSLIVDTITKNPLMSYAEVCDSLQIDRNKDTVLLTYHPVTIESGFSPIEQMENIFEALLNFDFQVVVTAPNMEVGRDELMDVINTYTAVNRNFHYYDSLGIRRFHGLLSTCAFLIGNSSSGIYESPLFKKPSIDIGGRQAGRYKHKSVLETSYDRESIIKAIEKAISKSFNSSLSDMNYEFGQSNTPQKGLEVIKELSRRKDLLIKGFVSK